MKPFLAFDTSALVSLGHTDLVETIIGNYKIIVSQRIIDELKDISKLNDSDAIASRKWLKKVKNFQIKKVKKRSSGEEELFEICKDLNIDLVSDDIKAIRRYNKLIDCYFSIHLIYALYRKKIITKSKAIIEISKMKRERDWKQNAISIAARILFK
ncbi:MAG: hypothetical protein JSV49_02640 [Thermoplasmata archaeon]|nr:MAG: hypothetical protein JSV49_02640 [Thermoplasmata archaeon]